MLAADRPALVRFRLLLNAQRTRTSAVLGVAWDQLEGYDAEHVAGFTKTVTPTVNGAKSAVVATASAFYSHILGIAPQPVPASSIAAILDLRSPFTATWHALSAGRPYAEAVAAGRSAVEGTGDTFLQSAARLTGDKVAESAGVSTRWERVAEPDACPWCEERNGGIYPTSEAADYGHDNCHCDPVPVN